MLGPLIVSEVLEKPIDYVGSALIQRKVRVRQIDKFSPYKRSSELGNQAEHR